MFVSGGNSQQRGDGTTTAQCNAKHLYYDDRTTERKRNSNIYDDRHMNSRNSHNSKLRPQRATRENTASPGCQEKLESKPLIKLTNFHSEQNETPLRPIRKAPAVPANRRPSVPPPPPPIPPPPPPPPIGPPPPPPTEPPPPPPTGKPPSSSSYIQSSNFKDHYNETDYGHGNIDDLEYRREVEDYPDYSTSPSYSPPSTPPPPLPTSPPPQNSFLDKLDYSSSDVNKTSPRSSNSSNSVYNFTSFRGDVTIPIIPGGSHRSRNSSNFSSTNNSPRGEVPVTDVRQVLPQALPLFSIIDEEVKTATIRGRVKPSRSALALDLKSSLSDNVKSISTSNKLSYRQPNPSLTSFDPLRRPRSMSPDDPYEHIYEELGSIPSSPTDASQCHSKVRRLSEKNHYTSYPNLYESSNKPLTSSVSSQPCIRKQDKLRHAQTLPPGIGKSIFDGATKREILEILKNAMGRLSSAAEEEEDEVSFHLMLCILN